MLIFHGTRLYGKVDVVPGLFHVATQFFHVQFIPVIPHRSVLVLDYQPSNANFKMLAIPLSFKSILIAWLRLALVFACVFFLGFALDLGPRDHLFPSVLGLSFCSAVAMFLTYRFLRAKPMRALELASQVGIPPEILAGYFAHQLTDTQLEELAQKARAAADPTLQPHSTSDSQL